MAELPKLTRDRLEKLTANAGGNLPLHPDADLLAGFVERSISAKEREQVMEHLASCRDCREALAMSLPAFESGQLAEAMKPQRPRWNLMRFGVGTATAAVIIAALVLFKVNEQSQQPELATMKSPSTERAKAPEPKPGTAETRVLNGSVLDGLAVSNNTTAKAQQPAKTKSAGAKVAASAGKDAKAPALNEKNKGDRTLDRNVGSMRPAISSPAMATTASPRPPPAEAGKLTIGRLANRSSQSEAITARNTSGGVLGGVAGAGAAPAPVLSSGVRATSVSPDADQAAQASSTVQLQQTVPVAQDTATAAQRQYQSILRAETVPTSADRTATGDAVKKTTGGTGPGQSGMSADDSASFQAAAAWAAAPDTAGLAAAKVFTYSAPTYRWRIADGKLQRSIASSSGAKWNDLTVAPGVILVPQILNATGSYIRVASTDGVLYYSDDDGAQWHRVRSWSGRIVSLKFFRTELGVLETSGGEKWVTGDGGATWHKQP